jgi:hypothetical protein
MTGVVRPRSIDIDSTGIGRGVAELVAPPCAQLGYPPSSESTMSWRTNLPVWCVALACAACTVPADDGGDPNACEAQSSEATCADADQPEHPCAWVDVQLVTDVDACQVASTEGRCISMYTQGAGCAGWSCDQTNYYTRVVDAGTELFELVPEFCGQEPSAEQGWRQCSWIESGMLEQWSEGQVCDCACGS